MAGDFGGAPHFSVEQNQRPRALGVEWAAVEQIGKRANRRQPIVQRVEYVRGAFVEDDMVNG
jgi:hypothetical protein